jgi:hypothetical protein
MSTMTFHQRIHAVLRGETPDAVPFAPYDNLIPRGDFAREMRNRGMGLCLRRRTIWSETPNVKTESYQQGDVQVTRHVTPAGAVSTRRRTHLERIDDSSSLELDGLIVGPADYAPVISMIDDTVYHADPGIYHNIRRDVGADGIVVEGGTGPPYDATRQYYGYVYGLDKWIYAQADHPQLFRGLLEALERRTERYLRLVPDSPALLVGLGSINGQYGPRQMQEYVLPFYERVVPMLHQHGKLVKVHAHASNLAGYVELIAEMDADIIEAFTPPPIGDLSLADARAAWGDAVIWVNFPETVFWYGAEETRQYTLDLLRSDPRPERLVIGMTEMGTYGVTDDESERSFKEGMRAIMDAIDEFSATAF